MLPQLAATNSTPAFAPTLAGTFTCEMLTHEFELPLRHTFTISRDSTNVQPTLIVELTDGEHRGFGEATTNTYYGTTLEQMRASLERVARTWSKV